MPKGKEDIENRFGYHPGTELTIPKHATVRQAFMALATFLDEIVPDGDAKDIAFDKLQEAAMWSNFAVAELAPVISPSSELPQSPIPGVDGSVEPQNQ